MRPFLLLLLLGCFLSVSFRVIAQKEGLQKLRTEFEECPLGIDMIQPRFSWQMLASRRGAHQAAYQLMVTDEVGKLVWNTGKVNSGISINILYNGKGLMPRTKYDWKINVWDELGNLRSGKSWFETGLLHPAAVGKAWNGAKWIGGSNADMVLYAQYLPVFNLGFSVQLDEESQATKAGFVFGANDQRLLDSNKNVFKLQNPKDSSYVLVELDIGPLLLENDSATIKIYRNGYTSSDKSYTPLKTFRIPKQLINKENKYSKHSIQMTAVFGTIQLFLDGRSQQNMVGNINVNPLGSGGDYIAFPVVGDIGFSVPKGQTAFFSDVAIKNYRSPANVLFSEKLAGPDTYNGIFSNDTQVTVLNSRYKVVGQRDGAFVTANPSRNSMPMLRDTFSTTGGKIAKARLYVTSRGIYDIYVNGKKVTNDYFNPGLTQYTKTHLYQTFDVTRLVTKGNNAMGAVLAEGWWSGGSTYRGEFWNFFGDRQSLLAQLVITYADGKEQTIVTDPQTWKYFGHGPVVYGSLFQGEVYDASKERLIDGWATAKYNDSLWHNCAEVGLDGTVSKGEFNKESNMPLVDDYSQMQLTGQYGQTVKKVKELVAVGVEEVKPGVFVYDMGQNMAGVPVITLKGVSKGDTVTLRFAEVQYPALPKYAGNEGMIMLENIRAAMSQDMYVAKGSSDTIHPRFTYHGYRYVEITGIKSALPLQAVRAEVLSSVHSLASEYKTSSGDVNQLWENITHSMYSNFMSIPTDCPQRNERLGWSGDISVFARTATYLADVPQFLKRHMQAMRDVQRPDGRFSDVAPLGGGFGDIMWGSAGITVAWESFQQYGDKVLLQEHYNAMKQYIQFLQKWIDPQTGVMGEKDRGNWGSLGDWLSPEYNKSEKSLLWECYFIYDLEIIAKMAAALSLADDAKAFDQLRLERRLFFSNHYIDKKTGITAFRGKEIDTQCSYALPLYFNVLNDTDKQLVKQNLAASVIRPNKADDGTVCPPYSLMTGFIGTACISNALSDNGYTDIAYRLLQQTTYPSWLYSVKQGATTIWERLESYTHTDGFGGNNSMNSFNHYSFGAVGAWMYEHSLGIQRDENSPGFKHFVLAPEPDPTGQITFARGSYTSMYGTIESSWQTSGSTGFTYRFVVPANTTATLYLAAESGTEIREGNGLLKDAKGVKYIGWKNNKSVFELPSGTFTVSINKK